MIHARVLDTSISPAGLKRGKRGEKGRGEDRQAERESTRACIEAAARPSLATSEPPVAPNVVSTPRDRPHAATTHNPLCRTYASLQHTQRPPHHVTYKPLGRPSELRSSHGLATFKTRAGARRPQRHMPAEKNDSSTGTSGPVSSMRSGWVFWTVRSIAG